MKICDLFDQCATTYDQDRPKLVPCFDEFYGTALRVIPFSTDASIRVLDLGAGTGLFSAMVAQVFPEAIFHLTDVSEVMLEQAQQRFRENPHVTFSVQDHLQLAVTSEYDLVLSALSIHHLENPRKKALFQKIHDALRENGMFINVDQALAPSDLGELEYERQWLEDVRANGISETSLEKARERMREDKNALLSDQLLWLNEVGFNEVDCWYKRFRFVVFGGMKTSRTRLI